MGTRITIGLIMVMLLAGCGLFSAELEEAPPLAPPPPRAATQTVEVARGSIAETLEFAVVVRSRREEALYFPVAGRVEEVLVGHGALVEAGQVIAVLEAEDLASRVALAQIDEEKAQLRLERFRAEGGDQHEARMLELDLEKARIQAVSLASQLERTRLRAPFTGRLESLAINPGDQVVSYATVAVLLDPYDLEITGAPTGDPSKLAVGQTVELTIPQLRREPLPATLVSLPTSSGGRAIPGIFQLDSVEPELELGMRGNGLVYLQRRDDVILIPNAAVRRFSGGTFVQVVTDGLRRDVSVRLGLVGEIESEVLSGLEVGQKVVIGQ